MTRADLRKIAQAATNATAPWVSDNDWLTAFNPTTVLELLNIIEAAQAWKAARLHCLRMYAEGSTAELPERQESFLALGRAEQALCEALNEKPADG